MDDSGFPDPLRTVGWGPLRLWGERSRQSEVYEQVMRASTTVAQPAARTSTDLAPEQPTWEDAGAPSEVQPVPFNEDPRLVDRAMRIAVLRANETELNGHVDTILEDSWADLSYARLVLSHFILELYQGAPWMMPSLAADDRFLAAISKYFAADMETLRVDVAETVKHLPGIYPDLTSRTGGSFQMGPLTDAELIQELSNGPLVRLRRFEPEAEHERRTREASGGESSRQHDRGA
jgi:hypothetical protein